jgi:hypothetical protein
MARHHRGKRHYSQADVYSIARSEGASDHEARFLAGVVPPESGGDAWVVNSIGATGLVQIYDGHFPSPQRIKFLQNPRNNIREGLHKLRTQGPGAWAASRSGWRPFRGRGSGATGGGSGGGVGGTLTTPGRQDVALSRQTTFDRAGFEKARKLALVGQLIAKRKGTDSPLFKTGLLTTQAPSQGDFMNTRLVSKVVQHGGGPSVSLGGGAGGGGAYPHGVGAHGTPNLLIHIGHLAQQMGLTVSENPNFGGVGGGHVPGSYHYRNEAVDISGNPRTMARLARIVEKRYGRHLAELIHNSPFGAFAIKHGKRVNPSFYSGVWAGHRNHVHIAVSRGGGGAA